MNLFILSLHAPTPYETIGEITMSDVDNEKANELLSTVADALSLHIENLRLTEQTQSALAETSTLYDFTAHLNAASNLNEILKTIAGLQKAERLTLMTIELNAQGQPDMVNIAGVWPQGLSNAMPIGTRLPLSQFPASQHWVEQPDEPLFYNDMATDASLDEFTRNFNLKLGVRGAIYMALRLGETWVGLLGISWSTPQEFGRSDKLLYQAVASQASVVINNRLLFEQSQKRAERETIINTISQSIQSTTSIEGALEAATREIGNLLKAKRAMVEINRDLKANIS